MRATCTSTTSTEVIAPYLIAAAVCNADHCQTGPLGGRALAGFGETVFFAFAAGRPVAGFAGFFVDFLAVFAELPFFLTTVFFAISRPIAMWPTLETLEP